MPTRERAPDGAPCWTDLWTSNVEAARSFYAEVFGWKAEEPDAAFGGYFMFTLDGVPVAGCMGKMDDSEPDNRWKVYLSSPDAARTAELASQHGGHAVMPPMPVADLGTQLVLEDAVGATVGCWQPGTFPGFTVLAEPGAPAWFELRTRDHDRAVSFYEAVFGWSTQPMPRPDGVRYTVMQDPAGGQMGGIVDATTLLPDGAPDHWSIFWVTADIDAAVGRVTAAGGTAGPAQDSPYGTVAEVSDPTGASFVLHQPRW